MKKVTIVGLGYIGLPTAIVSALSGYQVFGFDVDISKIEKINKTESPIFETGIDEKLKLAIKSGNFKASNKIIAADVFVVAVPTPFLENNFDEHKKADLSYVFSAAKEISKVLNKNNLVILESTVPVGTTQKFAEILQVNSGLECSKDFYVAHCPERVLPGKIFEELISNDRVIGGICSESGELAKDFYSKILNVSSEFITGNIYLTDDKTAEMVKLTENAYRDVNIAFANEVSDLAKSAGIDPFKLIELANKHPRVNILTPGCGVGGHCIAVDPWFLIETFPDKTQIIQMARKINDNKPGLVINNLLKTVEAFYKKRDKKPNVLSLGLTFKADVDDLRGSPALEISKTLTLNVSSEKLNTNKNKFDFAVYEPNIIKLELNKFKFRRFDNLESAVLWSDIILILVPHAFFLKLKNIDLKNKIIVDECGLMYKRYKN